MTGQATPALPPRPLVEVGGGKQSESQTESGEMQDAANHAGECPTLPGGISLEPGKRNSCSVAKTVNSVVNAEDEHHTFIQSRSRKHCNLEKIPFVFPRPSLFSLSTASSGERKVSPYFT